eukprot:TRINITY_DN37780_c0_g2_i1.p1 TRINITY_DN37780_c0_g2~~TRINITY_DN37780_c0_g2_i1.p1  ORF type:complete len:189 (+),score=49.35 TRINITY_DN37780_c0_g2_i1:25-567(+)
MASCSNCGKPGASQRCGKCQRVVYCSRTCQAADWRVGHRYACRAAEVPLPEHGEAVVEALKAADGSEVVDGGGPESEIRTDADNLGPLIRSTPVRRADAPIMELPAENDAGRCVEREQESDDEEDEEVKALAKEDAERAAALADSVEPVEKFQLDEEFDYDNCTLSQPEWPYNLRPRPDR